MALELPQHIQDLQIPQGIDARGGFSALGNNFANAVDDKDVRAAQERRIDKQLSEKNIHDLGVSGKAGDAGVRASGSAANTQVSQSAAVAKSKQDAKNAMDMALYLSMLDTEIDYWNGQVDEAQAEMDAQDILESMHEQGILDPDNPDHDKYFDAAGMDRDVYRANPKEALNSNRHRIQAKLDNATAQRDAKVQAREEADPSINKGNSLKEDATQAEIKTVGAEILTEVHKGPNAARKVDETTTEITNEAVNRVIDTQRGYAEEEADLSVSMQNDNVSANNNIQSISAASLFDPTPIQSDIELTSLFKDASGNDGVTQSADLGFETLFDNSPTNETQIALPGKNL